MMMMATMIKLQVLWMFVALAAGCSAPIEEMAMKYKMVLFGYDENHFARAGGLVDVKFRVTCVLKGDREKVHKEVFILATQSSYPCVNGTTPTLIGQGYIVGVERNNSQNFTWSKESLKENVAFPLISKNKIKLRQYCALQNPLPPIESPSTGGLERCPLIQKEEKLRCKNGEGSGASHFRSKPMWVATVSMLITRLLLFG